MANEAKGSESKEGLSGDQGALVPPTRAMGAESATGQALADKSDVPQGDDRGSKTPIAGGDEIKADSDDPKPVGAQLELARFTSNGQLPHNMVPTPSGPVPVGATALSQEDAAEAIRDVQDAHDAYVNRGTERRRLDKNTVSRLSIPEIQAIAQQRGYDIPEFGGARVMRQAFLDAQDDDKEVKAQAKSNQPNSGGAAGQAGTLSDKAKAASAQAAGAGAGSLQSTANTLGKPNTKA